ncbi:MAG: hypothetical protein IK070_03320 [Clostridia bacterium]|nr:hypothetical protein [Clostridia bacterium]
MEVLKLVAIGVVISVIAILLKSVRPELSVMVTIAGSILMLLFIINYFTEIFNTFHQIISKSGIDSNIFWIVIKIIGVGYLVEFGANICADSGNNGIADKIVLGGKIIIFLMAMPIVTSLFNIILELVP